MNQHIQAMAKKKGRTPAQVMLRWAIQKGTVPIPRSAKRERIQENAQVFDFKLSQEDMAALEALSGVE
jgi:diketogulonate reductase-like aldo/keto reductase